jgi:hypothetical protein
MGELRAPEKACLLVGVLCRDKDVLTEYCHCIKEFGDPCLASPLYDFDFTEYYHASMGAPLFRRFYLYPPGFAPETLADVKLRTNRIETEAAQDPSFKVARPLNLDPGYLTLGKLVLASTKDHSHRIYLRDGIFAEVTLHFRDKRYRAWPWTFPDFSSDRYSDFFLEARRRFLAG